MRSILNWKSWDCPLAGKLILIAMVWLQTSVYLYLLTSNQQKSNAVILSTYLLVTSFIMLVNICLSISKRFYLNYPKTFHFLGLLSITSRVAGIIMIVRLNNQVSDLIYITQEGYLGLFRNSIVFILMQVALIYQKYAFEKTKKQIEQSQLTKLIKI